MFLDKLRFPFLFIKLQSIKLEYSILAFVFLLEYAKLLSISIELFMNVELSISQSPNKINEFPFGAVLFMNVELIM